MSTNSIGTDALIEAIRIATPGQHVLPTSDQSGDGYDIAVAPHANDTHTLQAAAATRGALLSPIYASGALCGYLLVVPDADEVIVQSQHSGNWGPWYHRALYRRTDGGKWAHVQHLGGHSRGYGLPTIATIRRAQGC